MAVFADPTGAVISAWQAGRLRRFRTGEPNTFGWAEINARGFDAARAFYETVFGWTSSTSPMGEGQPDYTEFKADGESILGGMEMLPMVPAEVPSYWMPYFTVDDVESAFDRAIGLGATELVSPSDMPGGRFAIVQDPQGAAFGLLRLGWPWPPDHPGRCGGCGWPPAASSRPLRSDARRPGSAPRRRDRDARHRLRDLRCGIAHGVAPRSRGCC